MERDLYSHFPVVLAVAQLKGFAAAAKSLNMSPSAVGHAVRLVEDRLGEPLFVRTTRSVSVTEAGSRFLSAIGPAFADIDRAIEGLRADRGEITGVLRLNASRPALPLAVTPILAKLAWLHPGLTVEVHTNDAFIDIAAEGFDAGIRLGEAIDEDMVVVRLTPPFKAIMVAAPSYLAAKGMPESIEDLPGHNCIGFRMLASGGLYEWDVRYDGQDRHMRTSGSAIVTDASFARDLALAGIGIAYIFEPLVRTELREQRLRWLLPDTAVEEDGLFLYYPRRASRSPKLRAFVETARALAKQAAADVPVSP